MKKKLSFAHAAVLVVLCRLILGNAWGSPAEELMSKLPGTTSFLIATSGMDALEPDFQQAYLGRIWNDPQVQTFYHGIVDPLLSKVPNGMDPNEMEQIRAAKRLIEMCIRKPIVLGTVPNEENPDSFVCPYFVMDTGVDKPQYEKMLAELLKAAQAAPQSQMLGGCTVFVPEGSKAAMIYWGWVDTVFVAAFNDPSGRVIQSFGEGISFASRQSFAGLADRGDALAIHWDIRKFLSQIKRQIEKDAGPEDAAAFDKILEQLGLDQIQRFVLRAGFDGPNLAVESVLENPSAPRGLFAQLGSVRPENLCTADERAFEMTAANLSLSGMYDVIMKTIQASFTEEEDQQFSKQIAGLETELGFSIRADFLESLAGPMVGYMMPAYTIPEVPNGGGIVLADLKSPELFEKSMKLLEHYVQQKAKEQMQVQCQTVSDRQTLCIWVSPILSMAQVMPCWTIQDSTLLVASHPSLARSVMNRLAAKPMEGTICQNNRFQTIRGNYPSEAATLSYSDTAVQLRQFLTAAQQFWPMIAMAATQKGVLLPMMLPNLDKYLAELPPTIRYTVQTPRGLESRYAGPGLDVSMSTISGAAVGAGILMPALSKTKQVAQRVVSATNLKSVAIAAVIYANDHEGKYPPDLETLIKEADLDPKTLESPYARRKTTSGPDYIYISGQDEMCSPQNVLAYDNPTFGTEKFNISYVDGHVAAVGLAELQKEVLRTYENLNRPIPPEEKERLGIPSGNPVPQESENEEIILE